MEKTLTTAEQFKKTGEYLYISEVFTTVKDCNAYKREFTENAVRCFNPNDDMDTHVQIGLGALTLYGRVDEDSPYIAITSRRTDFNTRIRSGQFKDFRLYSKMILKK